MGHMDDDNIEHFTIRIRFYVGDTSEQVFHGCTEIDANGDDIEFKDRNGKLQNFHNVTYQIAEE